MYCKMQRSPTKDHLLSSYSKKKTDWRCNNHESILTRFGEQILLHQIPLRVVNRIIISSYIISSCGSAYVSAQKLKRYLLRQSNHYPTQCPVLIGLSSPHQLSDVLANVVFCICRPRSLKRDPTTNSWYAGLLHSTGVWKMVNGNEMFSQPCNFFHKTETFFFWRSTG